jgi:hypothetical protein
LLKLIERKEKRESGTLQIQGCHRLAMSMSSTMLFLLMSLLREEKNRDIVFSV